MRRGFLQLQVIMSNTRRLLKPRPAGDVRVYRRGEGRGRGGGGRKGKSSHCVSVAGGDAVNTNNLLFLYLPRNERKRDQIAALALACRESGLKQKYEYV